MKNVSEIEKLEKEFKKFYEKRKEFISKLSEKEREKCKELYGDDV